MMPRLPFVRIAKKNGIKRISSDALDELVEHVTEYANNKAVEIVNISKHVERRTVMKKDVEFIFGKQKRNI
ncbi:MAG: NFYB/HAP3 family transcription factor subunit [Candidatus Aenigmarchaeota archaeon]|nr:NFYB/HAP3 family transcription factor subunit [Candidatus Aenigmarchaeota archaeon]